jgi:uncharacterized protein related to proFAR isomerase
MKLSEYREEGQQMKIIDRRKVEKLLKAWKYDSGIEHLRKLMYKVDIGILYVYTSRPTKLLGVDCSLYTKYVRLFDNLGVAGVNVVETEDTLI